LSQSSLDPKRTQRCRRAYSCTPTIIGPQPTSMTATYTAWNANSSASRTA
jgi:hypothetical protein